MLLEITDDSFEQEVLQSKMPVLIDFWAKWCQPCIKLAPILEELSNELADKVKIVKMNIEENLKIPGELAIRSIPTLILFKDGQKIDTKIGTIPKESLLQWISSNI